MMVDRIHQADSIHCLSSMSEYRVSSHCPCCFGWAFCWAMWSGIRLTLSIFRDYWRSSYSPWTHCWRWRWRIDRPQSWTLSGNDWRSSYSPRTRCWRYSHRRIELICVAETTDYASLAKLGVHATCGQPCSTHHIVQTGADVGRHSLAVQKLVKSLAHLLFIYRDKKNLDEESRILSLYSAV
jgi:hypothetical protein